MSDAVAFEVRVANLGVGEVVAYDGVTGVFDRVVVDRASIGSDAFAPSALAGTADDWAVADFASGDVWSFDRDGVSTGAYRNGADPVRLEEPCSLVRDGDTLLALGNDSRNVVVLGPRIDDRTELGADQPIRSGHGVDLAPDGTVVVGTSPVFPGDGLIQVRDPATGDPIRAFAPYPELQEATDVTVVDDGIVVTDWFAGRLVAYTLDGIEVGELASGLDGPVATAVAPTGELYVLTADAIVAVDPTGAPDSTPEVRVPGLGRWVWARDLAVF
ncbi:MAG: hypothetical protein ABMB14_21410 [Myxococcota bacterium]